MSCLFRTALKLLKPSGLSSHYLNVKRKISVKQQQKLNVRSGITSVKHEPLEQGVEGATSKGVHQPSHQEALHFSNNKVGQYLQLTAFQFPEKSHSSHITLSTQQIAVLHAVSIGKSVFMTGSAGTGKSFLLNYAIALLKKMHQPKHIYVTASTGIAAFAINGQTLHSFSGVGLGKGDRECLLAAVARKKSAVRRWKKVKVLIIDEVSMIDGELFDSLEYIARMIRKNKKRSGDTLWGGIQLIVAGDFFQLPPVVVPNHKKEFAFEADCWNASFDLQVELTHIFRQSDYEMIELLQDIRRGHKNSLRLKLLHDCFTSVRKLATEEMQCITTLYPRNEDVSKVNNDVLRNLGAEIITYTALDEGSELWKSELRKGIAAEELDICLGARVMLVKNLNHGTCGLVNGATGVIVDFLKKRNVGKNRYIYDICPRGLLPIVKFDTGLVMVVTPESWDVLDGDIVVATRRQIPLILGWALSVHKCQGMTLSCLHTDLTKSFGYGMVYVALSRVKNLDGLYLSGFKPSKIKAHPKVVEYHERLWASKSRTVQDEFYGLMESRITRAQNLVLSSAIFGRSNSTKFDNWALL